MSTYSSGINTADADLISYSARSMETLRMAEKMARVAVPVLIYGESGTGKECIARYIHRQQFGTLNSAPYIGVNCAAIPDSLLEATFAEMHEKLWDLGAAATRDGLDCNIGRAEGCKLHQIAARPMTEVTATEADRELLRATLRNTVLPGFVKRCGARCGEIYDQVIAPISGVEYRP